MRITKWGEYGILCCLYMARKYKEGDEREASVGAAELAYAQNIPLQYTQQILQRLRKGDLIESVRGPGGGYLLSRPPNEINLKDILYTAEGETFEVICEGNTIFEDCAEAKNACALRPVWHELKAAIDKLLEGKSLQYLIDKKDIGNSVSSAQSELIPAPQKLV